MSRPGYCFSLKTYIDILAIALGFCKQIEFLLEFFIQSNCQHCHLHQLRITKYNVFAVSVNDRIEWGGCSLTTIFLL